MKKLSIIAGLVVAISAVSFYLNGSRNATLNRPVFAHLDKSKAKQAYKSLMRDVLTQKLDIDGMTEDQLDALLIKRYHQL